jgi:hypothetical protein
VGCNCNDPLQTVIWKASSKRRKEQLRKQVCIISNEQSAAKPIPRSMRRFGLAPLTPHSPFARAMGFAHSPIFKANVLCFFCSSSLFFFFALH